MRPLDVLVMGLMVAAVVIVVGIGLASIYALHELALFLRGVTGP